MCMLGSCLKCGDYSEVIEERNYLFGYNSQLINILIKVQTLYQVLPFQVNSRTPKAYLCPLIRHDPLFYHITLVADQQTLQGCATMCVHSLQPAG